MGSDRPWTFRNTFSKNNLQAALPPPALSMVLPGLQDPDKALPNLPIFPLPRPTIFQMAANTLI